MLNLDSRTRSKLALAATLVAPVLTVQAARLLVGPAASPGPAAAATVGSGLGLPPIVAEPPKPPTSAQTRAQIWLMSRTRRLQLRSPMDRPDPKPAELTPQTPTPATPAAPPPAAPEASIPGNLVLTGMIAGGARNDAIACINHRLYRVGDAIATNWTLTRIDARNRLVLIDGPEGRQIRLMPISPSAER